MSKLHLPASTKGKTQLSALEVEESHTIANVCQKCSLLQGTLPIDYVIKTVNEDCPLIYRISTVCCALCSVCNSVIPFD